MKRSFCWMVNFIIDTNKLKIFSKLEEFVDFPLVSINIIPHWHVWRMFSFPIINYCRFITDNCGTICQIGCWFVHKVWICKLILFRIDGEISVVWLKVSTWPKMWANQSCISLWCLVRWLDVLSNSSGNSFCKSCIILFETNNGIWGMLNLFLGPHLWLNLRFT